MNKNGGRPKLEIKKDFLIGCKVTKEEKEKFLDLFNESNYNNMSSMFKDILINRQFKVITTDKEMYLIRKNILTEVKRIGNNFNQLIKSFNQKKTDNFTKEEIQTLLFQMKEIEKIYSQIFDNLQQ